jgi:hypothetical protein
MILDVKISREKNLIKSPASFYNPSKEVKFRIQQIVSDFKLGREIANTSYYEFDNKTLFQRQSEDQKTFNNYRPPKSNDPDDGWKSNAVRGIARNRIISIAAHLTGNLIFPKIFAQNKNSEEDKEVASVMRELLEWTGEQSDYAKMLLYAVIAALVNPAVIIYTEFSKVMRKVKEIDEKGKWQEKVILDEDYSGFKDTIVPLDELFIGNAYEHDIQKQPFLIWRKAIDYNLAKQKYGDMANFSYVRPGIHAVFDADSDTFYDIEDRNLHERLVEEVIYWNRTGDLRLILVNGVLLTDPDQPNPRKDKKYPFIKGGYELIDEGKFFWYSSLAKKLSVDAEIINKVWRMIIDGSFLQAMPPVVNFGTEKISSSVIYPGAVTNLKEQAKLETLSVGGNLTSAINTMTELEKSISESSSDILQSGMSLPGSQTASELVLLQQNAKIMLGLFAKMIGFLVEEWGRLRICDILQFLTIGELKELGSDNLSYQQILIPNKVINGRNTTTMIRFNPNLQEEAAGMATDENGNYLDFEGLKEEGGLEGDKKIYKVNPTLLKELKYKVIITPDVITPPSEYLEKVLNLELYDRAIANPLSDQKAIYQDLLLGSYEKTKQDVDKYTIDQNNVPMMSGSPEGSDENMPTRNKEVGILGKMLGNNKNMELNKALV